MYNKDYKLPEEYYSLLYLHSKLGDVETVKSVCHIWNKLHPKDTVRYKTDDNYARIFITGICASTEELLEICSYVVSSHVRIFHEKTIMTIEV